MRASAGELLISVNALVGYEETEREKKQRER